MLKALHGWILMTVSVSIHHITLKVIPVILFATVIVVILHHPLEFKRFLKQYSVFIVLIIVTFLLRTALKSEECH